jgi:hypothetical protein
VSRRTVAAIAVAAMFVLMTVSAGAVVGQRGGSDITRGEPGISVYAPNAEVLPGSDTSVEMQIQNKGDLGFGNRADEVLTARSVSVNVTDEGPFDVRTGRTAVGTVQDGSLTTVPFRFVTAEDVEPGTYDVEVGVRYSYVRQASSISGQQRQSTSEKHTIKVRVVSEPRFAITDADTNAKPGTSGAANITVSNVGTERANATRMTLTGTGGVTLDGGQARSFLGDLAPEESTTVTVDSDVADSVAGGSKPIEATFEYTDPDGFEKSSDSVVGHLDVAPYTEQSFDIEGLEDTLSVGYAGNITGTLRNEGPRPVSDGVLVIEPASDSLFVEEGRYALPELEGGEATDFEFPTDVSGQALPGPRQVRFTVEYTDEDDDSTTTSDPISERVVVDERRGEFSLSTDNATVTAGGSTELVVTVTNERPETLRNIDARLYADSPLSSSSEEAFISELTPGESGELRFALSASGGTMPKTYPVEFDFQYDNRRGESTLSDTYQQPVEVEEPVTTDEGPPLVPIAIGAVVLIALVGGVLWWRRRD